MPHPRDARPRAATGAARRARAPLAVAAGAVVLVGLVVSRGHGLLADLAGGALYAVLVHLLLLLVAPRARALVAAGTALGLCTAVELAQLTPVPATVSAAWPPAAYVLGSTFVTSDLLAYAAGVAVVTGIDVLVARRTARPDDEGGPHGCGSPGGP